jgi:glycosyltransferase involved in cell wall biosynthesis
VSAERVAIVHEWLVTYGGSELVLAELLKIFPGAHVFTLFDHMSDSDRALLGLGARGGTDGPRITTSFLQHFPGVASRHRSFLPLFPAAVRSFDLRGYDLVISNSHAVAKGARTRPSQRHVCYCLSPMRYAWDLRDQYLAQTGLDRGLRGWAARALLERLRRWDLRTSAGVDRYLTLSHFVADRIERAYGRDATVVYPPVDVDFFTPPPDAGAGSIDTYVTAGRLVPYKRVDLIVRAFAHMPDRKLVVIGAGPEEQRVRAAARELPNVTLLGYLSREQLRAHLRTARAFLFAAEEDFGIAPLEAQACGTPVIAYGKGGAVETIRGIDAPEPTGLFFDRQTEDSLAAAVRTFETLRISPAACRANAEHFAPGEFRRGILNAVGGT